MELSGRNVGVVLEGPGPGANTCYRFSDVAGASVLCLVRADGSVGKKALGDLALPGLTHFMNLGNSEGSPVAANCGQGWQLAGRIGW